MKNGTLGKLVTNSGTWQQLCTISNDASSVFTTFSLRALNISEATVDFEIAITDSSNQPGEADLYEVGTLANRGSHTTNTCVIASPGETIWVKSSGGKTVFRCFGLTKDAVVN